MKNTEKDSGTLEREQCVLHTKIDADVMAAAKEAAQFEGRLLGKFVEMAIRERVERLGRKVKS